MLPLQFSPGENAETLGLSGEEEYFIMGLAGAADIPKQVLVRVQQDGESRDIKAIVRIDTPPRPHISKTAGSSTTSCASFWRPKPTPVLAF
ncbi:MULTISPECIES: hypothetical protein [Arthrobacter]|uniref:hypothetical protein n=1 Tax=Arthrobacter TaxID=1663 RepID=UPI00339319F7